MRNERRRHTTIDTLDDITVPQARRPRRQRTVTHTRDVAHLQQRRAPRDRDDATQDDPRLSRFESIDVGHEFYHGATLFVKKSASSAVTAITRRLQRFTPSTMIRPGVHHNRAELSARKLAADAYRRFIEACDQLRV